MFKKLFSATFIKSYRAARRLVIAVVGTTIVLIGLVMLITPGPAVVVIPFGLAILSIEFTWARRLLRKMRDTAGETWDKFSEKTVKKNQRKG